MDLDQAILEGLVDSERVRPLTMAEEYFLETCEAVVACADVFRPFAMLLSIDDISDRQLSSSSQRHPFEAPLSHESHSNSHRFVKVIDL